MCEANPVEEALRNNIAELRRRVAELERQNSDLQAANNRYLERARKAEATTAASATAVAEANSFGSIFRMLTAPRP